jgi:hypothetical protein
MSSIDGVSSSSSNSAAIYQEYLARQQAQKQSNAANTADQPAKAPKPVVAAAGDVDHDGDSH